MELEDKINLKSTLKEKNLSQTDEEETGQERPTPEGLRYVMVGLLVISLVGVLGFGYMRQSSVKPPPAAATDSESCKDPVTENRLRETLKQSPNDFKSLMDWGLYNLSCEKNYAAAVAAYRQAAELSDQSNSTTKPDDRTEAHFRLGLAYFYNQSIPEARNQFELIIKENPQDASALLALGSSYRDNPEIAAGYLKKVKEVAPGTEMAQFAQTLLDGLSQMATATPQPAPTKK
jgi:TolA-binding protein